MGISELPGTTGITGGTEIKSLTLLKKISNGFGKCSGRSHNQSGITWDLVR